MIPLFDAHCDVLYRLHTTGEPLAENKGHFDLRRAAGFAPAVQFFAAWGRPFGTLYSVFARNASQNADRMVLCRTAAEARAAGERGILAAFLSLEGGETVDCSEALLERAWDKGARMVSLAWNHDNALAGGANGDGRGLSEAGRAFARRARSLSMLLDVSHLSERSFWDLAEEMDGAPFIASHSNAGAVCPHRRNLSDEQALAVRGAGGFVGINLYAAFLTESGPATCESVWAHMERFLSLGLSGQLGLGCDLDGCGALPQSVHGVQDLGVLYNLLLRKNVSETLARDIFYHNGLRVVERVCDM